MKSQALEIYNQDHNSFKLQPIFIGHLLIVKALDYPIYCFEHQNFIEVYPSKKIITYDFIKDFAKNHGNEVFIHYNDQDKINESVKEQLLKVSRSLSIGDPYKNSTRQINLLGLQLKGLYQDPFSDSLLTSQFQSTKNLSNLLLNNKDILKQVYRNCSFQRHHFTINQPMLSSLLLISFISHTKIFNEKESQQLFLTSYFKDIGMSFIPSDKLDQVNLTNSDWLIFEKHSSNSYNILEKRVPLSLSYLKIIKNHHTHSSSLVGIETVLLNAMDTIAAMTSDRPYRSSLSIFESLEVVKKSMADDYSQEFKYLVLFLKQFFSNN